ncbi:TetR/AcrR family transcriptional regulator [Phytomonospora sp. NPDC050363]|uniref:TetR/AcrR family transcriptional regulator n=1 Tax=Phytomonospora sp. NPDC050363 TaxID=3155642 RepID=UPI0033CC9283
MAADVDEYGIPIIADPVSSSERKRASIVEAAVGEFLREGYAAASVDKIARRAGVSKPTIYQHFGNKERLFLAVTAGVLTEAYEGLEPLDRSIPDEPGALRSALTAYLAAWSRRVLCEDILALRRLVIGEVGRFPQLGRLWFKITREMMDAPLIETVTELGARGVLDAPDPERAVRQLIGMTLGGLQLVLTFLPEEKAEDRDIDGTVAAGVEVFLSHYGHR